MALTLRGAPPGAFAGELAVAVRAADEAPAGDAERAADKGERPCRLAAVADACAVVGGRAVSECAPHKERGCVRAAETRAGSRERVKALQRKKYCKSMQV